MYIDLMLKLHGRGAGGQGGLQRPQRLASCLHRRRSAAARAHKRKETSPERPIEMAWWPLLGKVLCGPCTKAGSRGGAVRRDMAALWRAQHQQQTRCSSVDTAARAHAPHLCVTRLFNFYVDVAAAHKVASAHKDAAPEKGSGHRSERLHRSCSGLRAPLSPAVSVDDANLRAANVTVHPGESNAWDRHAMRRKRPCRAGPHHSRCESSSWPRL